MLLVCIRCAAARTCDRACAPHTTIIDTFDLNWNSTSNTYVVPLHVRRAHPTIHFIQGKRYYQKKKKKKQ